MTLLELNKSIVYKSPPKYNVWTGLETFLLNLYESKILELGYRKVEFETVSQMLAAINKKSFDKAPKCYVITDDKEYLKAEEKWLAIKNTVEKSKHILIIKYTTLDKRSKMSKQEEVVVFDKMTNDIIFKHLSKILPKLDEERLERLITICDNDYTRCLLEADKIISYENAKNVCTNNSFDALIKDGTIHQNVTNSVFKLSDSVLYGDIELTPKQIEEFKLENDSPLGLLSLLYTNFRNMLLYQGLGKDKSNASDRTGLEYWKIKQIQEKVGGYKTSELIRALQVIRKTEVGIKRGTIPQEIALDYAILNIMK